MVREGCVANLGLLIRYRLRLFEQVEQDAGGKVGKFLGIAMGFAPQPGEINPQAVVVGSGKWHRTRRAKIEPKLMVWTDGRPVAPVTAPANAFANGWRKSLAG